MSAAMPFGQGSQDRCDWSKVSGSEAVGTAEAGVELSIIVVSYNTRQLTLECLESVRRTVHRVRYEVIVVDNASIDGSADAIASHFAEMRLIRLARNIGFAAANNLAAREAQGDLLLLLNPDTEAYQGAIDNLVTFTRAHPEAGICGGRTVFPDGRLNPASCWNRMTVRSALFRALGLTALFPGSEFFNSEAMGGWRRDTIREVDIVVGCFLMLSRSLWERLEGFDPKYFMYGEEADLCLRARRLGYRPMITPDATIMHVVGASTTRKAEKVALLAKAKATLVRHHWPAAQVPVGLALMWLWCATRVLASVAMSVTSSETSRSRLEHWAFVWRRRRDWLAGYR